MGEPLISIRAFSFSYDGKNKILEGINADIMASERILVLGPSGCGKSSLVLCLNGIIPNLIDGYPEGGLYLKGKDIAAMKVSELTTEIGVVFQDPESQFCMLKVQDEVAFGLENLCRPREDMHRESMAALESVGLGSYSGWLLSRLSGGMKQRVAIASILAMDQQVLVFDEPTSNLDPAGTRQVAKLIRGMPASKTLIVIEHKLDQFIDIFDNILLLSERGSMIAYGPTRQILKKYLGHFREMGIWIPQIPRFFLSLESENIKMGKLPLNLEQAGDNLKNSAFRKQALKILDQQIEKRINKCGLNKTRPALEVKDLSFGFSPSTGPVLKNINFTINQGDFVGIVGPNGSGKTTLAKIIIGLYSVKPPSRINFYNQDGRPVPDTSQIRKKCGYVFQNPEHQFIEENVYDELSYGLKLNKYDQNTIKTRTMDTLKMLGLKRFSDSNPFNLSQGQKRKLSVASILVMDHDMLILDEPTFGLDYAATTMLMELLSDCNRGGKTIIIITHDMNIIFRYTQRVLVLNNGILTYDRQTSELVHNTDMIEQASLEVPPLIRLQQEVKEYAVL